MKLIKIILNTILYFSINAILCAMGLVTLAVLIPLGLIDMLIVIPVYMAIDVGSPSDVLQWIERNNEEDPDDSEDSEDSEECSGATVDDCR